MELYTLTARELLSLYSNNKTSPLEVVNTCLSRLSNVDSSVKAFITITEDTVLKQAKDLKDINSSSDNKNKPLWGVPVAVKDNICTSGIKTTAGSKILESFIPPYDATVVTKLKEAGAIIIGKTNLDEFAMGSSTENSAFFPTKNPWDLNRVPGGSSGGSSAAVAAMEVPLALGSDTGGSVRQPAAFCGIVGLKPTYGAVSRYGLIAFASSLDQIGPMGRTVNDVELLFKVICCASDPEGYDPKDSTSAPARFYGLDFNDLNIKDLRVGVPNLFIKGLDDDIAKAIKKTIKIFEESGAKLIDVELPHLDYALASYYLVASSEASSNLARYDGSRYGLRCLNTANNTYKMFSKTRGEGFGKEVKRRIMLGTYALSAGYYDAYYLKAQKVRTLIKQDFVNAFSKCDLILSPTTPTPPFLIGEKTADPLEMYLSDLYTIPVNMAGLPALSLPAGFTGKNLPIGIQLIGKPFEEQLLFNIGKHLEQSLSISAPPLPIGRGPL